MGKAVGFTLLVVGQRWDKAAFTAMIAMTYTIAGKFKWSSEMW